MASLVLGHTQNILTLMTADELRKKIAKEKISRNVLRKFMNLCWATFKAILGYMWSMGHGLDKLCVVRREKRDLRLSWSVGTQGKIVTGLKRQRNDC